MSKKSKKKAERIKFDGMEWGERELAQILRRKMITRETKNKKKYSRKEQKKNLRSEISSSGDSFFYSVNFSCTYSINFLTSIHVVFP